MSERPKSGESPLVTPVLLAGVSRNGTTWLSNSILGNFPVAGPWHPLHHGAKEANVLANRRYWGDLANLDNFVRFAELMENSDYFRLAGGDKGALYAQWPRSFYEFYVTLMNQCALSQGLHHWFLKLDLAFFLDEHEFADFLAVVAEHCAEPKCLAIKREFGPFMRSILETPGPRLQGKTARSARLATWGLGTARYFGVYPRIEEFVRQRHGLVLSYEDFRADHASHMQLLAEYLELPSQPRFRSPIEPNSSFAGRPPGPVPRLCRPVESFGRHLPGVAGRVAKLFEDRKKPLFPLTWRLLKAEFARAEFLAEAERDGERSIARYLIGHEGGGDLPTVATARGGPGGGGERAGGAADVG